MMKLKICVLFLAIVYVKFLNADDEVVCVLWSDNLNDCIKSAMIERLPHLHNPKEQEVYDKIDPFLFEYGKLSFNDSKKFRGSFSVKNMLIEGGSKINIKRIAIKRLNKTMKILGVIHIPLVTVDGLFNSNLRLDNYLFKSNGNFNGTIEDMHGKFVMSGKLDETEDGLLQFKVERFNIFFVIIDLKIHLYGAQIDDNLSLIIDRIINESWMYVYQDLIRRTRSIWEGVAVEMSNEMFEYIKFQN